jgi:hypothetical protein
MQQRYGSSTTRAFEGQAFFGCGRWKDPAFLVQTASSTSAGLWKLGILESCNLLREIAGGHRARRGVFCTAFLVELPNYIITRTYVVVVGLLGGSLNL